MLAIPTQARTLKLWISGRVVPKARPRFYEGHVLLPKNYRGWKNAAYLEIINQLAEHNIIKMPIQKAAVEIQLVGKHIGDLDNLGGSVLDILTETKVIIDDRVSCVSRLVIEHQPSGDRGVWVEVKSLL